MARDIKSLCVLPGASIADAIRCLDVGACGIALVVDADGRLLGTITDGDTRRALLANATLQATVDRILEQKAVSPYPVPITALVATPREAVLALMRLHGVRQVPLLDREGRVADLAVLEELLPGDPMSVHAMIMAGGRGTRLLPLTEEMPKPMLPIGGRPLMEHIIEQLHEAGIRQVNVATHYKPERIVEHFGDGQAFGVDLQYVNEDRPLGTGGALGLVTPPTTTQLVINGDILTQVDFRAMLAFHRDNGADLTVAVRRYEVEVPYGVVECDGARVRALTEKPSLGFLVNAGVYLLEPSVYEFIPSGQSFNMTDLIRWLLDAGRPIIGFPIHEYWIDVGRHGDYAQAQTDAGEGRFDE